MTHSIPFDFIIFIDARSCVTCDTVLAELEKIDDDTDSFGVDFVKINDKRLAKQYGIKNFPALTYFRYDYSFCPSISNPNSIKVSVEYHMTVLKN
jgi:hypothetical protein